MRFLLKGLLCLIILYATVLLLRVFVAEVFWVPTASMKPNIEDKSYALVEKLSYGAVLPQSLDQIPWTNSLLFISRKFEELLAKNRWSYKRILACSKPINGDVLVFHSIQDSSFLIKRCVGIPGDKLTVENNIWYCNEEKYDYSNTIICDFVVRKDNKKLNDFFIKNNVLQWSEYINGKSVNKVKLSGDKIKKLEQIDLLQYLDLSHNKDISISKTFQFNFKIPEKGDTICLNNENYKFYSAFINRYEQKKIVKKDSNIFISGEATDKFIIENDYYFMMGDNRSHSVDSRNFGLIPFQKIIGKVFYTF
ncbi:signal peptidase I [Marinifilum sp.]|uniref:signal peptidase I n=1 Tax=Marinifilum sp. TaxID=2033137 RepID=UPI003BA97607